MKKLLFGMLTVCCTFCFQIEAAEHAKILAAYWGIKPAEQAEEHLKRLKANGFNTALVKDGNYEIRSNLWQTWAEMARKYEIQLVPVLNFAGVREIEQLKGQYRPYIDRNGKVFETTPCPVDATYWEIAIGQRFLRLARLASSAPVAGLIFDTEMYGSGQYLYRDLCFCDDCWAHFCQMQSHLCTSVPKEQRFAYLVERQLVKRYEEVQKQRLQDVLVQLRSQIHAVNPGIYLGFLAYRSNWFYAALIRGLGTTEQPVNVFTESSYISGYTPYIKEEQTAVHGASERQAARYVPGLWLGRFFPEELPSQLYVMAINTDGYWLFTTDSLWDNTPKQGHYAVHGPIEPYWNAFRRVNREIRTWAADPKTYSPDIPPLHPSSFYHASSQKLTTPSSLREIMLTIFDTSSENSSKTSTMIYRGKTLFHGFNTDGGTIKIQHVPIGNYLNDTHYMLFNSQGEMMQEGRLNRENPSASLSLSTADAQVVSLLTDSGANATRVIFTDMPYLIEASATFPCATINSPYTCSSVYFPEGNETPITIRARCSGQETALLRVQSDDARIERQLEIHDFTEMRISDSMNISAPDQLTLQFGSEEIEGRVHSSRARGNAEPARPAWKISIVPIPLKPFEDVTVYLYNYPFPYFIME